MNGNELNSLGPEYVRYGNFIKNHLFGSNPLIKTADTTYMKITNKYIIFSLIPEGNPFLILELKNIINSVKVDNGCFEVYAKETCKKMRICPS